jgi:predicted esterase
MSTQRPQPGAAAPVGHADPHAGQPVATRGPAIENANAAVILVHGRNAAPANILTIADALGVDRVVYLAPAAAHNTWYPYSFLTEMAKNEPGLSSGLGVLDTLVTWLEERGVPASKVVLMGFSQGACLASEYAVRHARRYGGVVAFSGGLIGPPGTTRDYPGSFDGTPVFLGCSDVDPHIPLARVNESEEVFRRMGAEVTKRIYPGMGHLVNEDELAFARTLLREISD